MDFVAVRRESGLMRFCIRASRFLIPLSADRTALNSLITLRANP